MDEDFLIIEKNTRNEKIKNFLLNNKKKIILFLVLVIIFISSFFVYSEIKKNQKIDISNFYNQTILEYSGETKDITKEKLIKIIYKKDSTYSPLSLYFVIDNELIKDKENINSYFDFLIKEIQMEKEVKNLIIFKKGMYNADKSTESEILNILKPIINSESIWKSDALYLMAEFFFSKNEKQKSKEFYTQILNQENSNLDLRKKAQVRLNRDLGD